MNITTRKSECEKQGESSVFIDDITCLECLYLLEKEWNRQVKRFTGHPLVNAKAGLKKTMARIKILKNDQI